MTANIFTRRPEVIIEYLCIQWRDKMTAEKINCTSSAASRVNQIFKKQKVAKKRFWLLEFQAWKMLAFDFRISFQVSKNKAYPYAPKLLQNNSHLRLRSLT